MDIQTLHPDRAVLTIREVVTVLGLPSEQSARQMISRGHIPSVKIGGRRVVPIDQLQALIAGHPADDAAQRGHIMLDRVRKLSPVDTSASP